MIQPKQLNAPCPYCKRQCRIGIWHTCEVGILGKREVMVFWYEGHIAAFAVDAK